MPRKRPELLCLLLLLTPPGVSVQYLQHQLLRASSPLPPSSSSPGGVEGGGSGNAARHVPLGDSGGSSSCTSLYDRVESVIRDSPAVWRIVLHYVLFPLLTFGFEYPYDFQEEDEGDVGSEGLLVFRNAVFSSSSSLGSVDGSSDSADDDEEEVHARDPSDHVNPSDRGVEKEGENGPAKTAGEDPAAQRDKGLERITSSPVHDEDAEKHLPRGKARNKNERESPYTFPSNSKVRRVRTPAAWMAAPLSRRYTGEGAVAALGAEEVREVRSRARIRTSIFVWMYTCITCISRTKPRRQPHILLTDLALRSRKSVSVRAWQTLCLFRVSPVVVAGISSGCDKKSSNEWKTGVRKTLAKLGLAVAGRKAQWSLCILVLFAFPRGRKGH